MRLNHHQPIGRLALAATAALIATTVAMAFGAGVSFAKTETKEATYYEDSLHNLCVGVETLPSFFTGSCEWKGVTGEGNVGVGYLVLDEDTEGKNNTASGREALYHNTTGSDNTASGKEALYRNTTGSNNTASGFYALYSNTEANNNTASGDQALYFNTTGSDNTASGYDALAENLTGSNNTASGVFALEENSTGSNNTASGYEALFENTIGSENVALGKFAGKKLTTGSNNIDIANEGAHGEEKTTHIGTEGTQTRAFMAGVYGKTLAGSICNVDVNSEGQFGCTSGATGPTGPTGPEGKEGKEGKGGASFEFGTGGANLANNDFVGLGSISSTEGVVQQSVAPSGTLTKMTCFQNGTASVAVTYTLRDNSSSTTLTCTVAAGSTGGAGTGSVAFASGDLLDVKTPASGTPGRPGSFSVSTG